jgi:hypothetical protein
MQIQRHLMALAFASGADIDIIDLDLTPVEFRQLHDLCGWLLHQRVLAAFTLIPAPSPVSAAGAMGAIRQRVGELVTNACLGAGPRPAEPAPAFLMQVWDFDHQVGGVPASTANFLGLDLEVLAPPSNDEEAGVVIPGLPGLRLLRVGPIT